MYSRFAEFKWQDWTQSIRVPLRLADVPPIYARPPNGWKRVDYVVKKGLAQAGLGRENWKRLGTRRSNEEEISQSLQALKKVPEKQIPCLSNDNVLPQLETRLLEKLSDLRAAWKKSHVPVL